jgi:hypothetical protein
VFEGRGYGPKWFARHLDRIPFSRRPSFRSEDEVVSVFRTIILQNIAVKDGFSGGIHSTFAYQQRQGEMVSGLLYDAYLKHLVNSAPKPDTLAVTSYYDENRSVDYVDQEKIVIREIRVAKRSVADSLLRLLSAGADFSLLAKQNSSLNPEEGGVYGPFQKNQNRPFFDAASLLEEGDVSPVLSSSGNNFSIIQLVSRIVEAPLALSRVYPQIESLLTKQKQDDAKEDGINGLLEVYTINKNMSLLD